MHPEHTDVLISVAARMLIRRVAPSTVVAYLASHLAAESDVYLAYVAARLLAPYVE